MSSGSMLEQSNTGSSGTIGVEESSGGGSMSSGSMLVCNPRQKNLLEMLLDKYEGSRTYRGTNQVLQRFSVDPAKIFPAYRKDTASVEQVVAFEAELLQLESAGLVDLEYRGGGHRPQDAGHRLPSGIATGRFLGEVSPDQGLGETEIDRVLMRQASVEAYYEILDRTPRAEQEQKELAWYRGQMGKTPVLDAWCREQIERLEQGKKPTYPLSEMEEIFRTLEVILSNQEEILERELSIDLFGDSKHFEKGLRRKVCRVLRESGLYDEILDGINEPRLCEQVLLGEHLVVPNPTYLYMKGHGEIRIGSTGQSEAGGPAGIIGTAEAGGPAGSCESAGTDVAPGPRELATRLVLRPDTPIAISSKSLPHILQIHIDDSCLLTVENLTAFQRVVPDDQFVLYLGGYHSTDKTRFLCRVAEENPRLSFRHFGDLDPDGFLILEHLRRRTKLDFLPWKMGLAELERYADYGKPLENQDRIKAENLLAAKAHRVGPGECSFGEVLEAMLAQNLKLEQEIIAWKER